MKLKYLWTVLVLWTAICVGLKAQPSAEIISADISICESGQVTIQIRFTGDAPFGLVYSTYDKDGNKIGITPINKQDDLIRSEDLVDGVWSTIVSFTQTTTIRLEEVFDKTSPSQGNPPEYIIGDGTPVENQSMLITVDKMPSPDAGLFVPQCGYEAQLNATLSNPAHSMYWSEVTGGTYNDKTLPNARFIAQEQGTYILTLTEVDGACEATDDVTVELWGSPRAVISGEQVICSNDGNEYTINVTTALENGMAPYDYKVTNGINIYSRNDKGSTDNFTLPATNETSWKVIDLVDNRGCSAHEDDITGTATVIDDKPDANAGLADNLCEGDLGKGYTLDAQLDKGEGGRWLDNANVTFSDVNNPKAIALANSFGTHTLTWQETYNGCSETSTVDITFIKPPTLDLLQPNTAICEGSSAVLRVNAKAQFNNLTLDINEDGTVNSYPILQGYNDEITFSPTETTNYQLLKLTDSQGCSSELTDQFNVTVDFVPEPIPGIYEAVCGDSIQMDAVLGEQETGVWTSDNGGSFTDTTSTVSTYKFVWKDKKVQEVHTLNWRVENINNHNCVSTASVDITFHKRPDNVFAGNDTTIYHKNQLVLNATVDTGMVGSWIDSDAHIVFEDLESPVSIASHLNAGENKFVWTVVNGVCEVVDDMIVRFEDLKSPNGFSPNNDNINECFIIGGADKVANNKFIVFDRNGKVVFQKNNFDENGWNGEGLDGSPLPDGTYYYIFRGDEGVEVKDYLIIKRSKKG